MRLLFGILLAVSILLFVALQWGSALTGAGKVNQASGEMNPEKIILLDKPLSDTASAKLPVAASAPVPVAAQPHPAASAVQAAPVVQGISPSQVAQETQPAKLSSSPVQKENSLFQGKPKEVKTRPVARVCISWGEFSGTDLARAEKILAAMNLGSRLSRHEVEYEVGYWVFLPPLKNNAAINRKVAELKASGIDEYFVLKDSKKYHNAISLGIFKTEESARHLQAIIRKKGFHNVQIAERKGRLKYVVFDIRELNETESSQLEKTHKDFPGSDLKKSSCPAG